MSYEIRREEPLVYRIYKDGELADDYEFSSLEDAQAYVEGL